MSAERTAVAHGLMNLAARFEAGGWCRGVGKRFDYKTFTNQCCLVFGLDQTFGFVGAKRLLAAESVYAAMPPGFDPLDFNDFPGRTKEEVALMLRAAAQHALQPLH